MKKTGSIVLLILLWVLIGTVWFTGLNWSRWITAEEELTRSALPADEDPVIIYSLANPDENTPAFITVPDTSAPEPLTTTNAEIMVQTAEIPGTDEPSPSEVLSSSDSPEPDTVLRSMDSTAEAAGEGEVITYVLNTHTKKIHLPDCSSVTDMKESNKAITDDPETALSEGYTWCKRCHG